MIHLHESEVPVTINGAEVPVGYAVHTRDFSFMAIYETDGSVMVNVEWGDDQPGDMASFRSMADAKGMLDALLGATQTETAKRDNDISKLIDESVEFGLKSEGLPDTPQNRLVVLSGMYRKASAETVGVGMLTSVRQAIQDKIIDLDE